MYMYGICLNISACTQILVSRADEEHCNTYLQLLDRVLTLEVRLWQTFCLTYKQAAPKFQYSDIIERFLASFSKSIPDLWGIFIGEYSMSPPPLPPQSW